MLDTGSPQSKPTEPIWGQGDHTWREGLAVFLGVGMLYYLMGWLALQLLTESEGVAVFWPASGLAAGAVAICRRHLQWPIALAVFAATVIANVQARSSLNATLIFALCNAAECLLFGWLIRRVSPGGRHLENLYSVVAFLVAAAFAAAVAALPAAYAIQKLGLSKAPLQQIWLSWFEADALGIIALAPILLTLPAVIQSPPRLSKLFESVLAVLIGPAVAYFAFGLAYTGVLSIMTPTIVLLPVFLWLAARTPAFFSAICAFVVAVVIVVVAIGGYGHFGVGKMPLAEQLAAAKVAFLTTSVALLTLSAMFTRLDNQAKDLRATELRLKLALEAGRMYAFDHDFARDEVLRLGGLVEKLGLPPTGKFENYVERLHPDDRATFTTMFSRLSPAEPTAERVFRIRARDGQWLSIEYRSEAEFDGSGRMLSVHGTCVDVTRLEAQAEQLRGALEAGRVFAFDFDQIKKSVQRSENAAEILGVPPEVARSARNLFYRHVHPDDRLALDAYGVRSLPDNTFKSATFRFIKPEGSVAWLEVQSNATFDDSGRVTSIRGLARDVTEKARADQRQSLLIQELDHRVKNALARMAVVIELSRDRHQTLDEYVKVIQGRIGSMARTQERLSRSRWEGVGIETLVADELAAYRKSDNCRIEGPELVLEPDTAQAFAFTLHELVTNAAKYGSLSRAKGKVEVMWELKPDDGKGQTLHFVWREIVNGGVMPPDRESYGLGTIRNLLRYEQNARVSLEFVPTGLVCTIDLPLPDPLKVGLAGLGSLMPVGPAMAVRGMQ